MSTLFSSPSKQATAAAQAQQGVSNSEIQNLEGYVNQQQQNLRGAISDTGANPYFTAASAMSPSAYAVNPQDTTSFGASGSPGTMQGAGTNSGGRANLFAAPMMPPTNSKTNASASADTPSTGASTSGTGSPGSGNLSINGFTNLSPADYLVAERQTEGMGS